MPESNFKFLSESLPELYTMGEFAEQYVYPDPPSSGTKLRSFGETFVKIIYNKLNLTYSVDTTFLEKLNYKTFKQALPEVVIDKLHLLRKVGNNAVHNTQDFTSEGAIELLKEAFDLGKWLYASMYGGNIEAIYFQEPEAIDKSANWEKEKNTILAKLYRREAEVDKLLKELELAREEIKVTEKNQDELKRIYARGAKVASELKFDEATTRRLLIDKQLAMAGWEIGHDGQSTTEVTQEEKIEHQPTETGIGYADYVLWDDDGKPLAVIEAKKTAKDANLGKKQAVIYADGLEKQFGQRPVIFYTNGYDIYIWDDAAGEIPRKIYGFYSKDSLQYLFFKHSNRQAAHTIEPNLKIADRPYQLEAIKRVIERFDQKERRALIVQATGTGKTRVAVSLCDSLLRAKRVKRILFLCDRRELRKQAKNVFGEHVPGEPLTVVNSRTAKDRNQRIYLATYPAMLKVYQSFDVGFFDLIIADESHRSIYNIYKELFLYFDGLQIGLTATPVQFIARNTFELFDCGTGDPTSNFDYNDAIKHDPPYLAHFEVYNVKTKFQQEGLKYKELSEEQQQQLEEQVGSPEEIEYESSALDKYIFNKDTNREIIRNLWENGIKEKNGQHPGKSIIFARSHNHAILMRDLFNEMFPQYGGKFCEVIDNYDPRAEQLIDDFKGLGSNPNLTIAISVDMLDTGIDVPEVVNLVFAKPVKSYVKFWQMIGRGTRLCEDLFGKGKHKTCFRIFDHWSNFEYFDFTYKPVEPTKTKSLLEALFEQRVKLCETAQLKFDNDVFSLGIDLIHKDINALESIETVSVKEKWKTLKTVNQLPVLEAFSTHTQQLLVQEVAPLMGLRNIHGEYDAYDFDRLVCSAQIELMDNTSRFQDEQDKIINCINRLQRNILQVKSKSEWINKALSPAFWDNVTVKDLETMRLELRGIMQFHQSSGIDDFVPITVDVSEDREATKNKKYVPKNMGGVQMAAYKERVESVLNELFEQNETLKKIKSGESVNEDDLETLVSLVLMQHPDIDLKILNTVYPDTAGHLEAAIRRVIGLDNEFVNQTFTEFVQKHPSLNAQQMRFVDMLKSHIVKNGGIQVDRLYGAPFTSVSSEGPEGLFEDDIIDDLLKVVNTINTLNN